MENRPEVVFYWLGLAKIGAVGALINHNLRDKSLLHCIEAGEAHGIVFTQELSSGEFRFGLQGGVIFSSFQKISPFQA